MKYVVKYHNHYDPEKPSEHIFEANDISELMLNVTDGLIGFNVGNNILTIKLIDFISLRNED